MILFTATVGLFSLVAPDPGCITDASPKQLAARQSPLDSVRTDVPGGVVKICYGRPKLRGRAIFGALVPYGRIWRTGANEPTIIHTTRAITVGGIRLDPGAYSVYTVPQDGPEWDLVLNRATEQWGIEAQYDSIRTQEIARARVPVSRVAEPTETLTITLSPTAFVVAWEFVQLSIPIEPAR